MNANKKKKSSSRPMFQGVLLGIMGVALCWGMPHQANADVLDVDGRIEKLERQLQEIREHIRNSAETKVKPIEKRVERLERAQPPSQGGETGNMVFFRGGGAWLANSRSNEVFTDVFGAGGGNNGDSGYYIGAGLDLVLSKNVWGMMSNTWVLGEIGVEFKRFKSKNVAVAVPATCAAATVGTCTTGTPGKVQITMLTVDISPKIMFMEGSDFRPWIIPVGLDFHVISPPSNDTTVLDVGAQFAVGAQYRLWKAFHVGVDARYHLAAGQTDTTNNFGTAGAYVGIAF